MSFHSDLKALAYVSGKSYSAEWRYYRLFRSKPINSMRRRRLRRHLKQSQRALHAAGRMTANQP